MRYLQKGWGERFCRGGLGDFTMYIYIYINLNKYLITYILFTQGYINITERYVDIKVRQFKQGTVGKTQKSVAEVYGAKSQNPFQVPQGRSRWCFLASWRAKSMIDRTPPIDGDHCAWFQDH